MDTFLDNLLTSTETGDKFKPVARYFVAMDSLIYLNEDLSYRADRVDGRLTLLWHPYEHTLIGIKLKGFKHMFETLRSISEFSLQKKDFIPIVKYIELALFSAGEALLVTHQESRKEAIKQKYQEAKEFAGQVEIPANELEQLAA